MTRPNDPDPSDRPLRPPPANPREARLKAALRANLARRKAQSRARADGGPGPDSTDGTTDD